MAGIRNQILILEDDTTQLNALSEAFRREGFIVHATSRPAEAESLLERNPIGTLFVDCLLPEVSGVEFVQKIRPKLPEGLLDVVFMSGIFTDPSFIKESLRSTHAKHFLKKPYELNDALALVDKPTQVSAEKSGPISPRKALYELFSKGKVTAREKRKSIEALDEIHGYDLPFIYSLLVESKASGHLNVATDHGEVFGITFSQGSIVGVDIPDQETYLGKLLLDGGYVHPKDLDVAFQDKSTRRIGEKLTSHFYVSPHALNIVLSEQMNIRISKTILNRNLNVNFVESEAELVQPNIGSEQFGVFLHDWIASKIGFDWLKAHFTQWVNSPLVKTPLYRADHPALQAPLVLALNGVVDYVCSGATFGQIVDSQKYQEESLVKAIHFLLTRGLVVFAEPVSKVSPEDQLKYLKKLHSQFAGRNKIEIYDLLVKITGANDSQPDMVIREFNKILGAKPAVDLKEHSSIYTQLLTLSQQAYEMAKTGNREKMKDELQKGEFEIKLKAANNFEEAKNLLQKSQFRPALEILKKVYAIDPSLEKLKVYTLWAKLGTIEQESNKDHLLQQIELEILQIPPEEKFDSVYNFVQGLVAKAKRDPTAARKFFEKAIALDSNMIVARREISVLASTTTKSKDMFNRDLKDVVGSFFGKK